MLSHLSLYRIGKSVVQRWKYQVSLKYPLEHEKCVQPSDLSIVGNSYEEIKSSLNKTSCGVNLKHHVYSQITQNDKDLLHKLDMMATLSTEHHVEPVIVKQQFYYSHTNNHILLPVCYLQHLMCQICVLSFVRSLHSCSKDHSRTKEVLGSDKKAVTGQTLSEKVIVDHVCGTSAAQESEPSQDFLKMLAKLLYCSVDEMKDLVKKYNFFYHLSPELITTKVNIMLQFGLPSSFISKNPRLLYQTSADELNKRLEMLKDNSFLKENSVVTIENLPHYLECRNDYFVNIFNRLCAERDSLEGYFDQPDYIQFRLKCSKEVAEQLLSTFPLNRSVSNVRLKKLLDFLLIEAQFSPHFVISHRNLMAFSVDRLRARWNMCLLLDVKSEPMMLNIFILSQKKFENKYGVS